MEILCSTGALLGRPNGRNYRLLEDLSKQLSCDGFEFMIYASWYPELDELLGYMKGLNLNIPVVHSEKAIGEDISLGGDNAKNALNRFELNCQIANKLGASKIVIHLWGGMASDSEFENNTNAYPLLAEIAKKYNLLLLVENIVCNTQDPLTRWTQLYKKYSDIGFVFDTKMSEFHGQTADLYAPENAWITKENHINHLHLNDYDGGYKEWSRLKTLPIGSGHVDFPSFFEFLNKIGYNETITVESTAFDEKGIVDIEMLNKQFDLIKSVMRNYGI